MAEDTHLENHPPQNRQVYRKTYFRLKTLYNCDEDNLPTREKSFQRVSSESLCELPVCEQSTPSHLTNWGNFEDEGATNKNSNSASCSPEPERVSENEICCCTENVSNNNIRSHNISTAAPQQSQGVSIASRSSAAGTKVDSSKLLACFPQTSSHINQYSSEQISCCSESFPDCNVLHNPPEEVCCDNATGRTIGLQTDPPSLNRASDPKAPAGITKRDSESQSTGNDGHMIDSSPSRSPYRINLHDEQSCQDYQLPLTSPCHVGGSRGRSTTSAPPCFILNEYACTAPVASPIQVNSGMCSGQRSPICPIQTISEQATPIIVTSAPRETCPTNTVNINISPLAKDPCPAVTPVTERICCEQPKPIQKVCFIPACPNTFICKKPKCRPSCKPPEFKVPPDQEIVPYDENGEYDPKVEEEGTTGFIVEEDKSDSDEDDEDENEKAPKKIGESANACRCYKHPCFPKGFIYCEPKNIAPALKKPARKSPEKEKTVKEKKPSNISWEDDRYDWSPERRYSNQQKESMPNTFSVGKIYPTQSESFDTNPCFLGRCVCPKTPCSSPIPNAEQRLEFSENLLHKDSSEILRFDEDVAPVLKLSPAQNLKLLEKTPKIQKANLPWKGKIKSGSHDVIAYPCTQRFSCVPPYNACIEKTTSTASGCSRRNSPSPKKARKGSCGQMMEKRISGSISIQMGSAQCCEALAVGRGSDCLNTCQSQGYEYVPQCQDQSYCTCPTSAAATERCSEADIADSDALLQNQLQPNQLQQTANQQRDQLEQCEPALLNKDELEQGRQLRHSHLEPHQLTLEQGQHRPSHLEPQQFKQGNVAQGQKENLNANESIYPASPFDNYGPQFEEAQFEQAQLRQAQLEKAQFRQAQLEAQYQDEDQLEQIRQRQDRLSHGGYQDYHGSKKNAKPLRTLYSQRAKVGVSENQRAPLLPPKKLKRPEYGPSQSPQKSRADSPQHNYPYSTTPPYQNYGYTPATRQMGRLRDSPRGSLNEDTAQVDYRMTRNDQMDDCIPQDDQLHHRNPPRDYHHRNGRTPQNAVMDYHRRKNSQDDDGLSQDAQMDYRPPPNTHLNYRPPPNFDNPRHLANPYFDTDAALPGANYTPQTPRGMRNSVSHAPYGMTGFLPQSLGKGNHYVRLSDDTSIPERDKMLYSQKENITPQGGNYLSQTSRLGNYLSPTNQAGNYMPPASQLGNVMSPESDIDCEPPVSKPSKFNKNPKQLSMSKFTKPTSQKALVSSSSKQKGNVAQGQKGNVAQGEKGNLNGIESIYPASPFDNYGPSANELQGETPSSTGQLNSQAQLRKQDLTQNNDFRCGPNRDICCCCQRPLPPGYDSSRQGMELTESFSAGNSRPNLQNSSAQTEVNQTARGVQVNNANRIPSYMRNLEPSSTRLSRSYTSKRRFDGGRRSPDDNCSPVVLLPICYNNLSPQNGQECCEVVCNNNCTSCCCTSALQNCLVVKPCKLPKRKPGTAVCNPNPGVVNGQTPQPSQCCASSLQPNCNALQTSTLRSGSKLCTGSVNSIKSKQSNISTPFILTFPGNNCQDPDCRTVGVIQNLPQSGSRVYFNPSCLSSFSKNFGQ